MEKKIFSSVMACLYVILVNIINLINELSVYL